MLRIPEKEVENRLRLDNPWWVLGQGVDQEYREWPRRDYYNSFLRLMREVEVRRAVLLMGPRRVGKTVMIFQAIQSLLDSGEPGTAILFVSLETPIFNGRSLESLLQTFVRMHAHRPTQRLWVFFDEIQYFRDWEVHLKSLVDTFRSVRFVATGSAAAALRAKSIESGAGRFTDFMLPPLTFAEYLSFTRQEKNLIDELPNAAGYPPQYSACNIVQLNAAFIEYLNIGGYPEAVMNPMLLHRTGRYLKSDIIDKVLLRDLPSLYGISDVQELNQLFNTIAFNTGQEVSLEGLSKESQVSKATLVRYLEYLEAAFLIRRVYRIDQNARRFKRATRFKVFLQNPSMRSALFGPINEDSEALGALTETAIFAQWLHSPDIMESLHYARWKQGKSDLEIDLVSLDRGTQKPKFVVEIKWSDRAFNNFTELRGLRAFCELHKLARRPMVTTWSKAGIGSDGDLQIEFTPSSLHCYTIARNLLR